MLSAVRHSVVSINGEPAKSGFASPITTDQAIRQSENKLLAVETNISNWQRKQNQNNNFSATIPYDMERQRNESSE